MATIFLQLLFYTFKMLMGILIWNILTLIASWLDISHCTDHAERKYVCLPDFLVLFVKLKLCGRERR